MKVCSHGRGRGDEVEATMKLAILGGGSWGTALSIVLAPRFSSIVLWVFESDLAERMRASRENDVHLPGFQLPANVEVTTDLAGIEEAMMVLGVMPSRHARALYTVVAPYFDPSIAYISATKGLEQRSLMRMSQVMAETLPRGAKIAVLSGPTFAREIAAGEPAAVVIASQDALVASQVQAAFSGPTFRLYTNSDTISVETGAALKNVIAIAAGVCSGLGLGSNTHAALVTRGLAEITRLAVAMGGLPKTMAGLAGLGDLVLTCGGGLSRNRQVGLELAKGRSISEITSSMRMVAEGVETCDAAMELGAKYQVDLPIIQQMYAVLHNQTNPRSALRELMERSLKGE
jgi:glycerol-3-phosphate dehydrogenase (NAD(P)+)